jgi:hypothetical protein
VKSAGRAALPNARGSGPACGSAGSGDESDEDTDGEGETTGDIYSV